MENCLKRKQLFHNSSTSLSGRMSFIQELFRRSRIDVDGNVNRKQIFYTAIILLFEGASKYIEALEPCFYRGRILEAISRIVHATKNCITYACTFCNVSKALNYCRYCRKELLHVYVYICLKTFHKRFVKN